MLIKYTPDQLDVEETKTLKDEFSGFIEVKVPSYPERLRFPKDLGIENLTEAGDIQKGLTQLEVLARCADKVKGFIQSVNMKHLPSGTEMKSVDDLYDFPPAGTIVTGLCTKFILGFLEKKV